MRNLLVIYHPSLISLFCGPGGMDQGFNDAGLITGIAYDVNAACVATHRANHPEAGALVADLSTIDVSDIITQWKNRHSQAPIGVIGGPPCQSFSVSNVFQNDSDPRHKLPEHYARILDGLNRVFNIDFFVFENVPGLLNSKHLEKFSRFKQLFEEAGFHVFEGGLDAQHFGVAQVRPRVFVVGLNKTKYSNLNFQFPQGKGEPVKTVWEVIGSLPEPTFYAPKLTHDQIPYHPNHWCMVPRSAKFQEGRIEPGKVIGRCFRALHWNQPSYTVAYGHREVHVHPNCRRRLSVLEAMLLQGFPPNYVLKGTLSDQIRLVSEAVSPPVATALANALIAQLKLDFVPAAVAAVKA